MDGCVVVQVATVLVYLSDVEEGGETSFLFEGVNGTKRLSTVDYKTCNTGIKYKPRAGDALLFWSIHPDHTSDKHALHGGCPVVRTVSFVLMLCVWRFALTYMYLSMLRRDKGRNGLQQSGFETSANMFQGGCPVRMAKCHDVLSLIFKFSRCQNIVTSETSNL